MASMAYLTYYGLFYVQKPENGNNGECVDGGGNAEPGGCIEKPDIFLYSAKQK